MYWMYSSAVRLNRQQGLGLMRISSYFSWNTVKMWNGITLCFLRLQEEQRSFCLRFKKKRIFSLSKDEEKEDTLRTFHIENNVENCDKKTAGKYVRTYILIYSTEQSPSWEATRFSASQGIPRILWKMKVHYGVTCPYPEPDQSSPCTSCHILKKILMLYSHLAWVFQVVSFLRCPHRNPVCTSHFDYTCYMSRQSHSSRFDHPNNI